MKFIDTIFHKPIGKIAISTVNNGFFTTSFHKDSSTVLVGHLYDTYIGCCSYGEIKKGRGKKSDVIGIHAYWVDVDIEHEVHKASGLPSKQEFLDWLSKCNNKPTIVVNSGYGYHLWYVLKEPIKVNKNANLWESRIKAFQAHFPFKVDSTHNLDRVLRIPNTMNLKRDPVLVTSEYNDVMYHWKDITPESIESPSETITVTSNGKAPVEKINSLMEQNEAFRDVYNGKNQPGDGTCSAIDFSLAVHCLKAKFDPGEVKETLISSHIHREGKRYHKHNRQDYFDRTISKAKLIVESELIIGFKIIRFEKFLSEPPIYQITTDKGIVKINGVQDLLSSNRFAARVFECLDFYPDLPKQKDWIVIVKDFSEKIEVIDLGNEGTDKGIVEQSLDDYIEIEGFTTEEFSKIMKIEGYLYITISDFRNWLEVKTRNNMSVKKLAIHLRELSFKPCKVFVEDKQHRVWGKQLQL